MKKSLLALAVLGAFAGAASAQSSVTIYGKLNVDLAKPVGKTTKDFADVAGSRLGFKGVEDLGGGLAATFGMEHRFNPATGADATTEGSTPTNKFWNGYSTVGLQGSFGHIRVGRDYTVAFLMIQNQIDPFGGDTQAALRGIGMIAGGGSVRYNSQVEYHFSAAGFNVGAQIAEGAGNSGGGGPANKAYSLAANYAAGPLFAGIGLENGGDDKDDLLSFGARYNLGFATLSAGYSKGTLSSGSKATLGVAKTGVAGKDVKGWLIGANVPVGAGDFKVGYATSDTDGAVGNTKKVGIGYHHNLSKRTKLFADYAKVGGSEVTGAKTGYDVGIQHNF